MRIEEFWNSAFLSALTRLPADEAKTEADKATQICIAHWQSHALTWAPPERRRRWQSLDVCRVPLSNEQMVARQRAAMSTQRPVPRRAQYQGFHLDDCGND